MGYIKKPTAYPSSTRCAKENNEQLQQSFKVTTTFSQHPNIEMSSDTNHENYNDKSKIEI